MQFPEKHVASFVLDSPRENRAPRPTNTDNFRDALIPLSVAAHSPENRPAEGRDKGGEIYALVTGVSVQADRSLFRADIVTFDAISDENYARAQK